MGRPHTPEAREKISKGRRELFKQDPGASKRLSEARRRLHIEQAKALEEAEPITSRLCAGCKEILPIEQFSIRRRKAASGLIVIRPESYCRACKAARSRAWRERKEAEGFDVKAYYRQRRREREKKLTPKQKAERRAKDREDAAIQRRREGRESRRAYVKQPDTARYPVGPIHEFVMELLEKHDKAEISAASGVSRRLIYRIEHKEERNVTVDAVDAILRAYDAEHLLNELYPVETEPEKVVGYAILDPEGLLESA